MRRTVLATGRSSADFSKHNIFCLAAASVALQRVDDGKESVAEECERDELPMNESPTTTHGEAAGKGKGHAASPAELDPKALLRAQAFLEGRASAVRDLLALRQSEQMQLDEESKGGGYVPRWLARLFRSMYSCLRWLIQQTLLVMLLWLHTWIVLRLYHKAAAYLRAGRAEFRRQRLLRAAEVN